MIVSQTCFVNMYRYLKSTHSIVLSNVCTHTPSDVQEATLTQSISNKYQS